MGSKEDGEAAVAAGQRHPAFPLSSVHTIRPALVSGAPCLFCMRSDDCFRCCGLPMGGAGGSHWGQRRGQDQLPVPLLPQRVCGQQQAHNWWARGPGMGWGWGVGGGVLLAMNGLGKGREAQRASSGCRGRAWRSSNYPGSACNACPFGGGQLPAFGYLNSFLQAWSLQPSS